MKPEEYYSGNYLPLNYYPWPNNKSPHIEQMGKDMDGWIDNDYTFLTPEQKIRYKKMRLHACTACMWPSLTYQQVMPCNRFMLQYVVFDDQVEHSSLKEIQYQRERCTAILRGGQPRPEENALYQQLAILRDEFRAFMPDVWVKRFADYFYISTRYGIELEHSFKLARNPPSLQLFKTIREYCVLMHPYLIFGEIASGLVLPDHIIEHTVMKRIISLVVRVVAWQNDIHSFPKEVAKDTEVFNIILVMQREYNISLEEAVGKALQLHNEELAELIAIHAEYRGFGEYQEHVDKFVYYAGVGLQGVNTFYLQETERYRHGGIGFAWPEETCSSEGGQ